MQNQNKWETEMNQTHFYKQPNFNKSSLCFHLITRLALSGSNLMQKKKRALLEHNNCKLVLTHFFKEGGGSGDQEAVIRKPISNQKILSEQ